VAAGRENLGDAGGAQARFGAADHRAQARAAGADNDDVKGMVFDIRAKAVMRMCQAWRVPERAEPR
jgi:hypothetical protein